VQKNDPYEGGGIANWKEVLLSEVCGKEIVKEEEEKESTEKLEDHAEEISVALAGV